VRYNPYRYRQGRRTVLYAPEFLAAQDGCQCKRGQDNGLVQKIKENPVVFVVGALLAGYLLAKKH